MSAELYVDHVAARSSCAPEAVREGDVLNLRRPNVAGDLPTVFQAAPMFRRAVIGYDRYQVDTYVQWAEDELLTAQREREHLVAGHFRTRVELEEARELLSHSADGGEMLRLSRRIGSILAAAADQADSMTAEAEACRSAASAQAERLDLDARAAAERMLAEAAREVERMSAEAGRLVDAADRASREARAQADSRLAEVRALEQRAAEDAGRIRRRAEDEAAVARLQARDDIVRMLSTGRDERRRADAEAVATRERLDRDAATRATATLAEVRALRRRRSSLRSEIRSMERRRSSLLAEVELLSGQTAGSTSGRLDLHLRPFLESLRWRSRSLRAP